jgi:hypothetical protein
MLFIILYKPYVEIYFLFILWSGGEKLSILVINILEGIDYINRFL